MKAAIYIGSRNFEWVEQPMPKPVANEVLLQIRRAGICGTDLAIFQGRMQSRVGPKRILGHEMTAIVREAPANGTFNIGDRVVVEPTIFCGNCSACRRGSTHVCQNLRILGIDQNGAFQEFLTVPQNRLHKLPDSVSDDFAVMTEPLAVAVHAVKRADLRSNETVVVIGGGTIGLLIATLAKKSGAKVFISEINPYRREFARELRFEICDLEKETIQADIVFEASGSIEGARRMTAHAATQARIILVGIHTEETPANLFQIFFKELSCCGVRAYTGDDFKNALQLISTGAVNPNPFISRHYPLEQIQTAMEFALSSAPFMKLLMDVST